jgi:tetratricopeptide (TPR) repeat protein
MQPQIFLSYSGRNKAIADAIDNDWQAVGLTLLRDVRDLTFKQNIKDFMRRVHKSDFVLLLISKDYLESKNCMYEALEMFQNGDFKRKILPILTDDAQITDALTRLYYVEHWEGRRQALSDSLRRFANPPASAVQELAQFEKIRDSIDEFASEVQSLLCAFWPHVQQEDYASIFDHIGYSKNESAILEACRHIITLATEEDQELALQELKKQHPESRTVLYTEATIAYRAQKFKKYRKLMEELLLVYPDFYQVHASLGYLLFKVLADYPTARYHLEQAIKFKPNYTLARGALALLLDEQFQEYDLSLQHYELVLSVNPDDSDTNFNFASLLSAHFKDFARARRLYEHALVINPSDADIHYNFAVMLGRELGEFAEARQHYEQALELEPEHIGSLNNLGITLEDDSIQDYEGARRCFERAVALKPDEPEAHYNLASLLSAHFEDYTGAREHMEIALQFAPDRAEGHAYLGDLLGIHFGEYEKARHQYELALELDPNDAETHFHFGVLLADEFNDYALAKHHLEYSLALDNTSELTHYNLARLLNNHSEEYALARHHFEQALILAPDDAEINYYLGLNLLLHFSDKNGQKYVERAAELAPDDSEIQYNLAVVLREHEDFAGAKTHYLRACELEPGLKDADDDAFFGIV